jgi:hypothetical protein
MRQALRTIGEGADDQRLWSGHGENIAGQRGSGAAGQGEATRFECNLLY